MFSGSQALVVTWDPFPPVVVPIGQGGSILSDSDRKGTQESQRYLYSTSFKHVSYIPCEYLGPVKIELEINLLQRTNRKTMGLSIVMLLHSVIHAATIWGVYNRIIFPFSWFDTLHFSLSSRLSIHLVYNSIPIEIIRFRCVKLMLIATYPTAPNTF